MAKISLTNPVYVSLMILITVVNNFHYVQCRRNRYQAFFIFGDSLVDAGNNNHIYSLAQANFYPYGVDFNIGGPHRATGRFCNGKTVVDFVGDHFGLPLIPPYLDPTTTGRAILSGVNYASAAGGILNETGADLIGRRSFDGQIEWFRNTITQLNRMMGRRTATILVNSALYAVVMGSNDFLNNFLVFYDIATGMGNVRAFQIRLLRTMRTQLMTLYEMGARNIVVSSLGPLGCIPAQLAMWSRNGNCSMQVNTMAQNFNTGLRQMLNELNSNINDAIFIYVNVYDIITSYIESPSSYGFQVSNEACCGGGRYRGQTDCRQSTPFCANRTVYAFWDPFHPTEAVNQKVAQSLIRNLYN